MKKWILGATLAGSVLALAACNGTNEAVVESKIGNIDKEEFYELLKDRYGEETLTEMVHVKVLEDKYKVSDKEIEEALQTFKDQYGDSFESVLAQNNLTEDELKSNIIRYSLLQQKAGAEDVKISDKEVKEHYDRLTNEVSAQHILINVGDTEVVDEEDKKAAEEIYKQLQAGGDFAALAKEHSIDEGTKEIGGDLGYFSSGRMVPSFEDAAYTLEPGTISEPVESEFGYHIIKVIDKRAANTDLGTYEEEKEGLREEMKIEQIDPAKLQERVQKLIKDAKVKVKIKEFEDLFGTDTTEK